MSFLKKHFNKFIALSLAVGGYVLSAANTYAAADADVSSSTSALATSVKDNVMGAIGDNIATIALGGIFILVIMLVWRLAKRMTK